MTDFLNIKNLKGDTANKLARVLPDGDPEQGLFILSATKPTNSQISEVTNNETIDCTKYNYFVEKKETKNARFVFWTYRITKSFFSSCEENVKSIKGTVYKVEKASAAPPPAAPADPAAPVETPAATGGRRSRNQRKSRRSRKQRNERKSRKQRRSRR